MEFDGLCPSYPKMKAYGVANSGRYNDNLPRHEKLETNGTHVAHAPTLDRLGGAAQLEI